MAGNFPKEPRPQPGLSMPVLGVPPTTPIIESGVLYYTGLHTRMELRLINTTSIVVTLFVPDIMGTTNHLKN